VCSPTAAFLLHAIAINPAMRKNDIPHNITFAMFPRLFDPPTVEFRRGIEQTGSMPRPAKEEELRRVGSVFRSCDRQRINKGMNK